jgi:pimeloyl-ACP methyl ester carboxylesterase
VNKARLAWLPTHGGVHHPSSRAPHARQRRPGIAGRVAQICFWQGRKWLPRSSTESSHLVDIKDNSDSITYLASFDRPVLVVVAERDSIVPAQLGKALYNALPGPKQLIVVIAAEHNDWISHVDDAWWQEAINILLAPSR